MGSGHVVPLLLVVQYNLGAMGRYRFKNGPLRSQNTYSFDYC